MMYRLLVAFVVAVLVSACTTPPVREEKKEKPAVRGPVGEEGVVRQLSRDAPPERNRVRTAYRFDRSMSMGRVSGVRLYTYRPAGQERVVGFALVDRGSRRINPRGLEGSGARREFLFQFPDRAREEIALLVSDDVRLSKRYSHDNMFRELYFFPRRQLPTLKRVGDRFEVHLTTGEKVFFDARTAEVLGGVLEEEPIDFNRNRHARRNPGIGYHGKGLLITVAQRGEAPRRARVWGQAKRARVLYPSRYSRPCYISPALLWDQRPRKGDTDPKLTWLLGSDREVFDLVEKQCHWDLAGLRARDGIAQK